jgi:hypothetical protein
MKKFFVLFFILFAFTLSNSLIAQKQGWVVGGKFGMGIGASPISGVSLVFGGMGEYLLNKNIAIGSEFNIATFAGTPIEWANYFKYYFDIPRSKVKVYGNAGLGMWFATGGPFFSIRFGGGANFEVAKNLYIPADLQLGPVFWSTPGQFNFFTGQSESTTTTIFIITISAGIRYYIN